MVIRGCRDDEAEAVLALWREAAATPGVTDTAEDLRRALAHPWACVLVAEAAGRLVGTAIGAYDGWRGNIYRLAVHPRHRRRGYARALVRAAEQRLARWGARRITALVEQEHPWATGFWAAAGYAPDPRMRRYVRSLP